ncbi:histidinol-phosphate transaminase [bacterium]
MSCDISKLVRKEVLNFQPYVPGKPIKELQRELHIENIYKLASNENSLGCSKRMLDKLGDILPEIYRYPESSCYDLRRILSDRLNVCSDNLLFGNGSDEIIELLGKTFLNKEDEIITSAHSFVRYEMAASLMGAKTKIVPMKKGLIIDTKEMLKAVSNKTKLIFIGNPNNPTGTYVNKIDFVNFLKELPENVLVVVDEAYYEYVDANDYPDTLCIQKDYNNLIILRTFSKLFGLAGLRIGYMIADTEIVSFVDRIRPPFNVNLIAQAAAVETLDDGEHIKKTLDMIKEGKEFLYTEFNNMKISYIPTAANFILFKTKYKGRELFEKLLKKGVIVRSVDEYDLAEYARVTIGTKEENEKFIASLKELLNY